MSNRPRLILFSGTSGSDVTSIARAAAEAALDEGLRVAFIDDRSMRSMPGGLTDAIREAGAALGTILGADRLPVDVWSALPGMSAFAMLAEAALRAEDPELDVVIADCGELTRALELVRAPTTALRVVDALLTPTLAMWRPQGAADAAPDAPFVAVSALRARLGALRDLVEDERTTMRIVTASNAPALARAATAAATFAMLGVGTDAVIVQKAPRKGADKWAIVDEDERIAELTTALMPLPVWASGNKPRPAPKGRSLLGPFGGEACRLSAAGVTIVAGDEDFVVDLPLLRPARDAARVGVRSGELVIEFDDVQRWLSLPPLLQRCRPTVAARTINGLRVHFVPDPELWPDILAGEAA